MPIQRYEVDEANIATYSDVDIKHEPLEPPEDPLEDTLQRQTHDASVGEEQDPLGDNGNVEEGQSEVKLRFDERPDNVKGPTFLKVKIPHKMLLSDNQQVTGHFDLVVRRKNYPNTPVDYRDSDSKLTASFRITSVDGVQYGPIKVTGPGGEVIHPGASFFAKNLAYVMISFNLLSTAVTEEDRKNLLQPKLSKLEEVIILDHNTGKILDTTEIQIVAEVRLAFYYPEETRQVLKRKRQEEGTGRRKSAPAHGKSAPSTSGLGTSAPSTSGVGTNDEEEETDKEGEIRKQQLVNAIKRVYDEKGRLMSVNDLKFVLKMSKALVKRKWKTNGPNYSSFLKGALNVSFIL